MRSILTKSLGNRSVREKSAIIERKRITEASHFGRICDEKVNAMFNLNNGVSFPFPVFNSKPGN